jgi:Fe-S oxidoreductase
VPLRSRLIGNFSNAMKVASVAPAIYNFLAANTVTAPLIKQLAGFAPKRSLPGLGKTTLRRWYQQNATQGRSFRNGRVYLFCDEFNFNDVGLGIKTVRLLNRLGYEVLIPEHVDSGRAQISKGLLREAQRLASRNVELLKEVVTGEAPLIGIEPSAILGFRDEIPDLVPKDLIRSAEGLAKNAFLIDEFIAREADRGRIKSDAFIQAPRGIKLHGHCHQKALSSAAATVKSLELPVNYQVEVIPSGW